MSSSKMNRSFQFLPPEFLQGANANSKLGASWLIQQIAVALKAEFGIGNMAVRNIAQLTLTNERAVKNWMNGQNGPSVESFVMLCRHSDNVLELLMRLSGREDLLAGKRVGDCRLQLRHALQTLDSFEVQVGAQEPAC